MALTIRHVVVDCDDAFVVAKFWAAALDLPFDGGDVDFASIGSEIAGRGWLFFRVPEVKAVKNRMHIDFQTEDREVEVDRLVALGASIYAEHDEWGARWTVLQDPEGNEFCVVEI